MFIKPAFKEYISMPANSVLVKNSVFTNKYSELALSKSSIAAFGTK